MHFVSFEEYWQTLNKRQRDWSY